MRMIIAAPIALLLAGCSSQQAEQLPAPLASTTSAAQATRPATLTIQQAAAAYTSLVDPVNKVVGELESELSQVNPDMAKVHAIATRFKAAHRKFLDAAMRTPWPAEVRADMEAMEKWTGQLISWADQVAAARTPGEVPRPPADGGVAQLVRARLGLGTVPTTS